MDFKYMNVFSDDNIESHLKRPGFWEVANIKQQIGWPERKTLIEFRNNILLLLPEDDILYPCIAFWNKNIVQNNEARILINHYLSTLLWLEGGVIYIVGWTSGGPHPIRMRKSGSARIIRSIFHYKYFPDPTDKNTRLALALYREALSLNNVAYSFLSFYKIINLKYSQGSDQKKWIEDNLKKVSERDAIKRREELSDNEDSVSDYIYVSCRCAIAHAGTEPTIDPENYDDKKRLGLDLPLIKNLAEIMIEQEFGIKSTKTINREHYYELYGFKKIFDPDLVRNLKERKEIPVLNIEMPLSLSVRLWNKKKYLPFERLKVNEVRINHPRDFLVLTCISDDKLVQFELYLDFANEKLKIDPFDGIILIDNKDEKSSNYFAEYFRFLQNYFANGRLEVWNADSEECLSQCDAFIPVNIEIGSTIDQFKKQEEFYINEALSRKIK
ncbi:hypothetical protein D4R71_00095 [bacterium]|nr:MAG: hypothetical protein D4R71_00095 [bacterium]